MNEALWNKCAEFHGHTCPGLATGFRVATEAMAKLGLDGPEADEELVCVTENDTCAVDAVQDNLQANGIDPEKFTLLIGNLITEKGVQDQVGYGCYAIVAANILADVLVALTPVVTAQMKPGAIYILSGIIDDKEAVVKEAVQAAGLELLDVNYQGEWVGITARKPIV